MPPFAEFHQLFRKVPFSKVELWQIDQHAALAIFIPDQTIIFNQVIERGGDLLGRDAKDFDGLALQVSARCGAVPVGRELL